MKYSLRVTLKMILKLVGAMLSFGFPFTHSNVADNFPVCLEFVEIRQNSRFTLFCEIGREIIKS